MQKQCETPVLPPCYALGYPPILLRVLRGKFSKIILFLTALFHRISLYFTVNYPKFSEIIGNLCVFSLEF